MKITTCKHKALYVMAIGIFITAQAVTYFTNVPDIAKGLAMGLAFGLLGIAIACNGLKKV